MHLSEIAWKNVQYNTVDDPSDVSNWSKRKMSDGSYVTNLDEAKEVIDTFIIHDPGILAFPERISAERALEITRNELTLPNKKKSAHWTLAANGTLYKHLSLLYNAWHAGTSELYGRKWLNNYSVGIEVIGPPYTDIQYYVLAELINRTRDIFKKITPQRILGHYHISPGRKVDPREFDFEYLFQIMYDDRKQKLKV